MDAYSEDAAELSSGLRLAIGESKRTQEAVCVVIDRDGAGEGMLPCNLYAQNEPSVLINLGGR